MPHQYFKERKGFDRLFNLLKQKYISLNRFSGTVTLNNVTELESKELSSFFGRTIPAHTNFKTSFSKIEKKLKETKYADFTWADLFQNYFNENIITNKESKEINQLNEYNFYQKILNETPVSLKAWLENIIKTKDELYQNFRKKYKKDSKTFKNDLLNLLKIMDYLNQNKNISLTMLASISSNPHFLDIGSSTSNLFFKMLSNYYNEIEPKTTEEKIKYLLKHNIYIDSLSNYIIIYNLKSDSNLINSFTKEKEPLNLNLSNLSKINKLDTNLKKVFVLENPSLLPILKKYDIPIIITSGNPNYIFYKVIEKLIETNNQIYYNGDFDPEGLLIAHNIKEKFPNTIFFCYQKEDYLSALSKNQITQSRLKKLDNIQNKELQEIKKCLKENKYASYQEKNINNIENHIKSIIKGKMWKDTKK